MKNMSKEYIVLFNEITDASETMAKLSNELCKVTRRLMYAQLRTEEMFLEEDDYTNMLTE